LHRQIIYFWIFIFLSPVVLFGQKSKWVKYGVNYSYFRSEEGNSNSGVIFGLGKDFFPIDSFHGFLGFELNFVRKKVLLENRNLSIGFLPDVEGMVNSDIQMSVGYLEIPIRFGYFSRLSKLTGFKIYAGPSISLPIDNESKIKYKESIYFEYDQAEKYEIDYYQLDLDPGEWPFFLGFIDRAVAINLNLHIGASLYWKMFVFDINYSRASNSAKDFIGYYVGDKLDSFQSSIGLIF